MFLEATKREKVTQDFNACRLTIKVCKFLYYLSLWVLLLVLYTPEILNANIEQEAQNMSRVRTLQESEFLKYFRDINKCGAGGFLRLQA